MIANSDSLIREGLRMLEQEDNAKLEWLRGAVMEGLDEIDRGEGIEFNSMEDLEADTHRLGEQASTELAAERKRA